LEKLLKSSFLERLIVSATNASKNVLDSWSGLLKTQLAVIVVIKFLPDFLLEDLQLLLQRLEHDLDVLLLRLMRGN